MAGVSPAAARTDTAATGPTVAAPASSAYGPPVPAPVRSASKTTDGTCRSQDARDIVVCGQRRQGYRLDPSVVDAEREVESSGRSAGATMPAAQASCAASPMGCGTGLEGMDLVNVAAVVGTAAVRAAKGEDWTRALKTGGPDEYQLYLEAKRRREAQQAERAQAAAAKARRNR